MQTNQISLFFVLSASLSACAALGPDAQMTFKVIDDFGRPLAGIKVRASAYDHTVPGEDFGRDVFRDKFGITDTNGLTTVAISTADGRVAYGVASVPGYYYSSGGEQLFTAHRIGRWEPWNPMVEIVLKPILNPVAGYYGAPGVHLAKPNKRYGLDLMVGDLVFPDGMGKHADMFLEVTGYWKSFNDHDSTLVISFTNNFDGIQEFSALPPRRGSDFRSPRYAPETGYVQEIRLHKARQPQQLSPAWVDDTAKDHCYFFRIRSQVGGKRDLQAALYGKIEDGFYFGGAVESCYFQIKHLYLNPEPNSRNMEFDPKKNLLGKTTAAGR